MKLWPFKNGIKLTEATFFYKKNHDVGTYMSRKFEMGPFCSLQVICLTVYCAMEFNMFNFF